MVEGPMTMAPRIALAAFVLAASGLTSSGAAQAGVWTQEPGPQVIAPLSSGRASFAYDTLRGRTVLFAVFGSSNTTFTVETWEYDGISWLHCNTMPFFTGTTISNLAYDELRGRTVVVTATVQTLTTAEWDGSRWSVRDTRPSPFPTFPPTRIDLAYDLVHAECVCVTQAFTSPAFSTRTWNGATWSVRSSATPFAGSMTFDVVSGQVLMAGNNAVAGSNALAGWDGTAWHQISTLPAALQLTGDPWRARVLGVADNGSVFEWRGTSFQSVIIIGAAATGTTRALTYDLARSRLLRLADGAPVASSVTSFLDLPTAAATFALLGSGCAGPLGVPALAAVAGNTPRIGQPFQLRLTSIPDGPMNRVFGLLGTTATAWNGAPLPLALGPFGAPGCSLFIAPEVDVQLVPVLQTASWSLSIPANLGLIGVHLYLQGAVLVPGFNAAGAVFTNAGHAGIGT